MTTFFVMTVILSYDDRSKMKLKFQCWSPQKVFVWICFFLWQKNTVLMWKTTINFRNVPIFKGGYKRNSFWKCSKTSFQGKMFFFGRTENFFVDSKIQFFLQNYLGKHFGYFFLYLIGNLFENIFLENILPWRVLSYSRRNVFFVVCDVIITPQLLIHLLFFLT